MKIVKLSSENVKRLSAVAIEPGDASIVKVGGKNHAGKSSVLDSIAYALGGKDLVPQEPIKIGETEAKIVVDLGEFTVTRRFSKERLECNCGVEHTGDLHLSTCASHQFGVLRSTLVVTNKDGARYPSPQALLDKLLGRLTFDPLAFAHDEPKRQAETLRQLTNLDFAPLDKQRKELYDERTMTNKSLVAVGVQVAAAVEHKDVPAVEIGADAVRAELEDHRAKAAIAQQKLQEHDALKRACDAAEAFIKERQAYLEGLKAQVVVLEQEIGRKIAGWGNERKNLEKLAQLANIAAEAVPDVAAIDARLTAIADTNKKVRENEARKVLMQRHEQLSAEADLLTAKIEALDEQRAATLAAAKFPVDGLSLTDSGVTFNGVPFEQASSSEQLRVSVAIGLALNPKLRVLLVRNGNLLDEDGQKVLAEMAEAADAQVWMEFVTSSADGVSVMIEDGHVR